MKIAKIIIQTLLNRGEITPEALEKIRRETAKKFNVPMPPNHQLLEAYQELLKLNKRPQNVTLQNLLRKRKIRSLSGIVVVAVLTKPYPCGGICLFCPIQKGIPKSYLEQEPAVMRALVYKYNPYAQTQARIKTLKSNGHPTDKIDLRIIGGTWSNYPGSYRTWFIKRCFQACNEYGKLQKVENRKQKIENRDLTALQKANEKTKCRIVGINIETRPDYINETEIKRLRELGVTRVELGVQSLYDDVLKLNRRGHKVEQTVKATKLLKDSGFKVCYQIMPNLPGSNLKRDRKIFKDLFSNPDFRPDHLKIYPCALLKQSPLYWMRKKLRYRPYSRQELIELLREAKMGIPYYCRIQRIIRDIPSPQVVKGGVKTTNLRQILLENARREGWRCHCIRCREIRGDYQPSEKIFLFRENYEASDGKEIFLSYENKNRRKLYSLLRFRIPSSAQSTPFKVLRDSALIREVQTYGQLHPLDKSVKVLSPQHKGLGKRLIRQAEKIAKGEFGLGKIAIISGVGARNYFRKLGYRLKETYMAKEI